MPTTKHVDKLIEAYLDERLSLEKQRQVGAHIRECPDCARRLFDAKRLDAQLGTILRAGLGQPKPRPMLRQQVREALGVDDAKRSFHLLWTAPVKFINAVGTAAMIALLAFGAFMVIRSQVPGSASGQDVTPLAPSSGGEEIVVVTPVPTRDALPQVVVTTPSSKPVSLEEQLPLPKTNSSTAHPNAFAVPTPVLEPRRENKAVITDEQDPIERITAPKRTYPKPPAGTIAYALFNPAPDHRTYEIHFVSPDGTNHRQFALGGVSEPALHPTSKDYYLAFRAWSEPTSPRSLISSDAQGQHPRSISHFWEDAQPDWSPTEDRIIFASQREVDRRWRLYSAWGDGSTEKNLRREGKSPTFAPDGYRFAFESCDNFGNSCGLWIGDLESSEYQSKPILLEASAKAPDWSPVSDEIAYMANPDGNWDLYIVNSDGSNRRRLSYSAANDGLPTWSPDGRWLAFVSDRGGEWGIWLLHVGNGHLLKTIAFGEGSLTPPDRLPYSQHGERRWWDEQLSWRP